jgi:hypothetical protein
VPDGRRVRMEHLNVDANAFSPFCGVDRRQPGQFFYLPTILHHSLSLIAQGSLQVCSGREFRNANWLIASILDDKPHGSVDGLQGIVSAAAFS